MREESLKNSQNFGCVYKKGKSYANKHLVLYILKNGTETNRVGISVSKKVGNSVVRHRVTRMIRESYRLNKLNMKTGYDLVVVARVAAKGQKWQIIEQSFLHLCKMHGIYNI